MRVNPGLKRYVDIIVGISFGRQSPTYGGDCTSPALWIIKAITQAGLPEKEQFSPRLLQFVCIQAVCSHIESVEEYNYSGLYSTDLMIN